jgi:Tol biopolymer transport system component/DNA-binding winged helix-turn-helix (wHTH) protein
MSFWFGDFEVDQERRQLLRAGEPVPLEPKAYELLSLLLERRPRALSRAQIRDVIWPQTFVSESTLAVLVNGIRQALSDDARHPRFIRTVHGFGYAFCGEAHQTGDERPGTGDAHPEAGGAPRTESSESAPPEPKQDASVEGSLARRGAAKAGRRRWAVAAAAALAVLSAGWYWFDTHRTASPDESPTAVPLTSLPGVELHPALSPDGGRVAFIWDGPDRKNFDVYVKEIASGGTVRVTSDPAADYHPVWSPDGRRLAFLRRQGTGASVILVPAGGGEERELAPISDIPRLYLQDLWSFWLDWSPDGRFLAVSDRGGDGQSWGVYLIFVETGEKRALTTTGNPRIIDRLPAFSPDGRTLAFLRGSFAPRAELFLQPLTSDGTPAAPARAVVEEGVAGTNDLSWTPGGRELVVGDWRISPGGERSRPFRLPGRGDPGQWGGRQEQISIRGTRLVFSTPESQLQLFRVSLAGASWAQPAPFLRSTRGENHAAFSPDGRRVAFCSSRSGDQHIWVCDVDGSGCSELPLPRGSPSSCSPSWSPDGRRLAFDAFVGEACRVYSAPAEGAPIGPLTSATTYDARPRWSRDGRWIYFASTRSGDFQIWKNRADAPDADATAVRITRHGGIEAEESPDGRHLYYAKRGTPGVWRRPLDGPGAVGEERILDIGGEGRWVLRPGGILVLAGGLGVPPAIRFFDFATRRTSEVLALPADWDFVEYGGAFAVSPDGQWAVVNIERVVESDLMLVEGFR